MPSRTFDVSVNCKYRHTVTFGDGDPVVTNPGPIFDRVNQVNWADKVPNYRRVIAEGNNATTNLSFSGFEYFQDPSFHRMHCQRTLDGGDKRTYLMEGNHIPVTFPSTVFTLATTDAINQALIAFYSHLNAVDTTFKGMVFGGEFPETLRMLRHPFRALRRGIGDYLNYVGNVGRRLPRQMRPSFVRRTWLEYSYGWAPLISDCGSAIDAFYASQIIHPIFEMVRGRASNAGNVVESGYTSAPVLGQQVVGRVRDSSQNEVKFYGVYHSTGAGLARDAIAWGFRPSEFIPTIYELIPYSFLVDYFTNVGKVIESWSYRSIGARFMSQTIARHNTREWVGMQTQYTKPLGTNYTYENQAKPGRAAVRYTSIQRSKNASYSLPTFSVKVPGKWYQWVNVAALSANHRQAVAYLKT